MDSTKLRIVLRTAYLFCFVDLPCGWFFFFFCLDTSPLTPLRLCRSFIRQGASLLAFYSEKTLRWLVPIIAMFQVNHRIVSIGLSHCFFVFLRIRFSYFIFTAFT